MTVTLIAIAIAGLCLGWLVCTLTLTASALKGWKKSNDGWKKSIDGWQLTIDGWQLTIELCRELNEELEAR